LQALRHHLDFATGFRSKFMTGYWSVRKPASASDAARALQEIPGRLAELSSQQATKLLIHYAAANGRLQAWLFDRSGVIASGETDQTYDGIDLLRSAMGVEARTATRAPRPRRAPPASPPQPASDPALSLEETLVQAAAQLFPGDIADALAVEGGRLLLLSARDTGTAPLAALPIPGGERLADRWATLVLPDVRALLDPSRVYDMREVDLKNALVVGDPNLQGDPDYIWQQLPGARKEAAEVVEIMRIDEPRLLIDGKATKAEVTARLAGKRTDLIYLATHGIANSTHPMDGSFLALANGHLFGGDLRHSRFDIWSAFNPLVVLSACQTGLGRTFEGGAYGIARAWVQAGAAQVVASLWNVSDEATQQLMARFADKLDIGATPEEAMRSAQLNAASLYPDDPGAWASFAVMGMPAIRRVN
jgi:hypothetical protein